jgi:uncharacterized protein (TIGR00730 family)
MTVLGPGTQGVVVATADDPQAIEDLLTLRGAGIPAATVGELGLSMAAPEDDPAAFWARVTRRTTVARDGDAVVVALPGGTVETRDRSSLAAGLPLSPPRPRRVAVFGGAWTPEDDPDYAEALSFGRLMAGSGVDVVSGGYGGVMTAVSQGTAEAKGTAVGVTIGAWDGQVAPNEWITHRVEARDLFARYPLICDAEAWVAFPGGVGTLAEVAFCWNLMQQSIEPRPLLVVGERWDRLLKDLREQLIVVDRADLDLVRPVPAADEAAALAVQLIKA